MVKIEGFEFGLYFGHFIYFDFHGIIFYQKMSFLTFLIILIKTVKNAKKGIFWYKMIP